MRHTLLSASVYSSGILPIFGAWGASAQSLLDPAPPEAPNIGGNGWRELFDLQTLSWFIVAFIVTALLTATIAYHPRVRRGPTSQASSELPMTLFTYALVGMICGFLFNRYGATIGFVVFGIGSLMRFRTNLDSSKSTGRLIIAALIGLCVGLQMPHVAVLSTASAWVIIYLLERSTLVTLVVRFDNPEKMVGVFATYRQAIAETGCLTLRSKQSATKPQFEFKLKIPQGLTQTDVEAAIGHTVNRDSVGQMHWERN